MSTGPRGKLARNIVQSLFKDQDPPLDLPEEVYDGNLIAILNAASQKKSAKRDRIFKTNTNILMKRAQDCVVNEGPWVDYAFDIKEVMKVFEALNEKAKTEQYLEDCEFNRAYVVLFYICMTDNKEKWIFSTPASLRIMVVAGVLEDTFAKIIRHEAAYRSLVETFISYLPFWCILNVAMRRCQIEVAGTAARFVEMMLENAPKIGVIKEAWDLLILSFFESVPRLDPDIILKRLGANAGLIENVIYPIAGVLGAEGGPGVQLKYKHQYSICRATNNAYQFVYLTENYELMQHICANERLRDLVLENATNINTAADGPMLCQHAFSAFLSSLVAPPRDTSDPNSTPMKLWRKRIALFDVADMISKIQTTLVKFLKSDDVWKAAAKIVESLPLTEKAPELAHSFSAIPCYLLDILRSLSLIPKYHNLFDAELHGSRAYSRFMRGQVGNDAAGDLKSLNHDKILWKRLIGESRSVSNFLEIIDLTAPRVHVARFVPPTWISFFRISGNLGAKDDASTVKLVAEEAKLSGNNYFADQSFLRAVEYYSLANEIGYTSEVPLRVVYLSNRAEAYLKLQEADKAMRDLEAALVLDPLHEKSISRKQRAQKMIQDNVKPEEQLISKVNLGEHEPLADRLFVANHHIKPTEWNGLGWKYNPSVV